MFIEIKFTRFTLHEFKIQYILKTIPTKYLSQKNKHLIEK